MSDLGQNGRAQNAVSWSVVGIVALADATWIIFSDFHINLFGTLHAFIGFLVIGGLHWFYCTYRNDEKIAAALSAVLLLLMFTAVAAPLSYLTASLALPFWDSTLHAWDEALGLDWRAYLAWVNERPLFGTLLQVAYASLLPQLIIACIGLGFTGRLLQLRSFILAVIVSGVLCILISAAMPAMAMYVHLGLQPSDFPNLSPAAAYVHVEHIHGLRDGTLRALNLNTAEGIITFPSYHAALAIIFLVAFWSVPLLRWPGVVLNLALIAGTPIDGGHYFVDLGAGMAIALVSILAASRLSQPFKRSQAVMPVQV
jgi:PAP2 superfamily